MRYYKFKGIYNGLSSVQKKVYGAVPIAEAWDTTKIKIELARTSSIVETRILMGCLNGLIACGLVKEYQNGTFQRVPIDAKTEALIEDGAEQQGDHEEEPMTEAQMKKQSAADPIEKISKLTEKCKGILEMLKELASDIDTVAIEVQESFTEQGKGAEKLKQLQQLLKSIG